MNNEQRHFELYPILYEDFLKRALLEDLGLAGDVTTQAIVPASAVSEARIVSRASGRVAGIVVAGAAFKVLDSAIEFVVGKPDGSDCQKGDVLATVKGSSRAILSAERVALNVLGKLSGIATTTRNLAQQLEGTNAQLACTRKTTPGLRALEKFAVRCGGGRNHRFGLDDAILIKDNHIAVAGSVTEAVRRAREVAGHMIKIEVEVDTLAQLDELLALKVDAVLLDNMSPVQLKEAVKKVAGRMITEASGGINPTTIRAVAETGVDLISAGWLTHSATVLDVGLDF